MHFCTYDRTVSADFQTRVEPCQFGGDPDCSRCGCVASMGLAAIGHRKVVGSITAGDIFWASSLVGDYVKRGKKLSNGLFRNRYSKKCSPALFSFCYVCFSLLQPSGAY